MMHGRLVFVLGLALVLGLNRCGWSADPSSDESRLKEHLGGIEPKILIDYLERQMLNEVTRSEFQKLIQLMGDRSFKTRQDASKKVVAAGPVILPLLEKASESDDREVASRARRCMADIRSDGRIDLPEAAVRQLIASKNDQTTDVLLKICPNAWSEGFRTEILKGLSVVGKSGDVIHPSLKKALDDADPARRSLAVQVLLPNASKEIRAQIKVKLTDPDPAVRYHVATGLFESNDRDVIPVLIELVRTAKSVDAWQHAEEMLYRIGGELAPQIEVGEGTADDRKRISDTWAAWWRQRGAQILLGQNDDRPNDAAIVTDTAGRVWDWRPDGKPAAEVTDQFNPVDARVLFGRRLLIADESGATVSERNFRGQVLWKKTFDEGPVSVQRLPNGSTFVATYSTMHEVRRDGSVSWTLSVADHGRISDANRLVDGRIACLFSNNELKFFDNSGKVLAQKRMASYGGVDALPNGNVMVSQMIANTISEVDPTGKVVWEKKIPGVWVGVKLPDGHYLLSKKSERKMVKIDSKGTVVWEKPIELNVHAMHWK